MDLPDIYFFTNDEHLKYFWAFSHFNLDTYYIYKRRFDEVYLTTPNIYFFDSDSLHAWNLWDTRNTWPRRMESLTIFSWWNVKIICIRIQLLWSKVKWEIMWKNSLLYVHDPVNQFHSEENDHHCVVYTKLRTILFPSSMEQGRFLKQI